MRSIILRVGAAAGLLLLALGAIVVFNSGGERVFKPQRMETLIRMPLESGEESRRFVTVDGALQEVYIVFQDGCRAKKTMGLSADGKPLLLEAEELFSDGSRVKYGFAADGQTMNRAWVYRKDGSLFDETVIDAESLAHSRLFALDGSTLLAEMHQTKNGYVFTVYDTTGRIKFVEESWAENPGNSHGNGTLTFTVYNGAATPVYRQVWNFNSDPEEDPEGEDNLIFTSVEDFHPGTTVTNRRFVFYFFNGNPPLEENEGIELTVFGLDGKEKSVRHLSLEMRVLRVIDRSVKPERKIEVGGAVTEEFVEKWVERPDNQADAALRRQALSGLPHSHLNRIIAP